MDGCMVLAMINMFKCSTPEDIGLVDTPLQKIRQLAYKQAMAAYPDLEYYERQAVAVQIANSIKLIKNMDTLTTWDIPEGAILVSEGIEYTYKGAKRERLLGGRMASVQYFVNGRGKKANRRKFITGVRVVQIEGKYYIASERNG